MSVSIVVAYDELRVIGNNGMLPWRLPDDMRLFKDRTQGGTCIMGRKTWQGLRLTPRPLFMLPGRNNVVITSEPDTYTERYHEEIGGRPLHFVDMEKATRLARAASPEGCFLIGGEEIYTAFLSLGLVDRVFASEVNGKHEGDAFFPPLGSDWVDGGRKRYDGFTLVEYERTQRIPHIQ